MKMLRHCLIISIQLSKDFLFTEIKLKLHVLDVQRFLAKQMFWKLKITHRSYLKFGQILCQSAILLEFLESQFSSSLSKLFNINQN